jgi:hypothetical protein
MPDPKFRLTLTEAALAIGIAVVAAPGIIWWIGVFLEVFAPTVLGGNR